MPLHPNDSIFTCSGACTENHQGKAFLNSRSLKCHEMLFHSEEDDALPQANNQSSSDDVPNRRYTPAVMTDAQQYKELEPHTESLSSRAARQEAFISHQPECQQQPMPASLGNEGLGGVLSGDFLLNGVL